MAPCFAFIGTFGFPMTKVHINYTLPASFDTNWERGNYVVTVALVVFAFTTILGWSYYGERCWEFLFHEKSVVIYRVFWVLAAAVFANLKVGLVWNLADTLNGLMAVPNLIGLLVLSPMIFKITKEYFAQH